MSAPARARSGLRPADAARSFAAWGVGLAVLAVLARALGERDRVALAQLPAAALGSFALAGLALLLRRRDVEEIPDASPGAAALGLGLVLVGAGAAVGLWLVLLAVPVLVLGVIALVLETRS